MKILDCWNEFGGERIYNVWRRMVRSDDIQITYAALFFLKCIINKQIQKYSLLPDFPSIPQKSRVFLLCTLFNSLNLIAHFFPTANPLKSKSDFQNS